MDGEDLSQLTQPSTQPVLDPRRINGGPSSGFSDEDIADIICILHPISPNAQAEVDALATRDSPLVISTPDNIVSNPRFANPNADDAGRFELDRPSMDHHSIILRLSSAMKDQQLGFVFGRNAAKCDICFTNDPMRRLSNAHFRIYVNEHGIVMLEDRSTNGTYVDGDILRSKGGDPDKVRRTLTSGCKVKIFMHQEEHDLIFVVRIPRREGRFEQDYLNNVQEFHKRLMPPPPTPNNALGRNAGAGHMGPPPVQKQAHPQQGGIYPPAARSMASPTPQPWDGAGKYNRGDFVGKGAFAMVYKVTHRYNGTPYAAKELDYRRFIRNGVLDQKVENEMKIMRQVRHENIIQYIDHFDWDSRMLIIIMEYVSGGDLGKYVTENGPLPEAMGKEVSRQMLSALEYLHQNNITHRDVKPDNILISSLNPFTVKLTDFGLSKMVDNEQTFLRTFCGTLLYCAPEVYSEYVEYDHNGYRHPANRQLNARRGQRYGHLVDVWSLGGVIFYILSGSPPFPVTAGITYTELLHTIMTQPLNTWPLEQRGISLPCRQVLLQMLQRRPEHRTPIAELLVHLWFNEDSQQAFSSYDSVGEFNANIMDSQPDEEEEDDDDDVTEITGKSAPPKPNANLDDVYDDVEMSDSFLGKFVDNNSYDLPENQRPGFHNDTFGLPSKVGQTPLFGEVGANLADSGALPADSLFKGFGKSELIDPDNTIVLPRKDGQQDGEHFVTIRPRHHHVPGLQAPDTSGVSGLQSADQVLSLVEGVASQSLNSEHQPLGNESNNGVSVSEFTTSKRKPAFGSSEEYSDQPSHSYAIKRPRPYISPEEEHEMRLIAALPCIAESVRQINQPVNKKRFWDKDRKSYHLRYPEMTLLQMTAFKQAAMDRGEKFEPHQTPLWELAMKYFPPTDWSKLEDSPLSIPIPVIRTTTGGQPSMTSSDLSSGSVPISPPKKLLACLESTSDSTIQGLSIPIHDSIITWGRSPDNLIQHTKLLETRIPKFAFKMLLYAPDYDASRDKKGSQPWDTKDEADEPFYHFYIASKATRGIYVNGVHVPSYNATVTSGECRHWICLYNGDEVMVWGSDNGEANKLSFRCNWGGSTGGRPKNEALQLVDAALAKKLDDITYKAERRRIDSRFYEERELEANREFEWRDRHMEREQERSVRFEEVRKRAVDIVKRLDEQEKFVGKERGILRPVVAGRVQTI